MKLSHLLAIALVSAGAGGTAAALTLLIEVAGARSAQGSVNAALYASETGGSGNPRTAPCPGFPRSRNDGWI